MTSLCHRSRSARALVALAAAVTLLVLAERGKYAEAIRAWERSLQYDPQNTEVRQSIETARGLMP